MKKEKVEIIKRPAERFKFNASNPKKAAWSATFESIITIILGVLLVACSGDLIVKIVAYLVGGFLLVKGGVKIASYLMEKGQTSGINSELFGGIVTFLIGLVIFVVGDKILDVFRVLVGVWIIYCALIRLCNAVRLHSIKSQTWSAMLVMSVIMLVFGMFITFFDGALVFLIGWIMIVVGLIGLLSDIVFMQNLNALVEKIKGNTKSK